MIDDLAESIKERLSEPSLSFWAENVRFAGELLGRANEEGNENQANAAWYLGEVSETRRAMIDTFRQIKDGEYYKAWCQLERIEISNLWILRNPILPVAEFQINEFARQVATWQKVFPYRVFISPEFVVRKSKCSICGAYNTPWKKCTHKVGRVYSGDICCRIIEDCSLLSVSLVLDPAQKYSVARIIDGDGNDQFDYSLVKFVSDRLENPFSRWSFEIQKRFHSHNIFGEIGQYDPCPCDSGRAYGKCCLHRHGVIRPHYQFQFDVSPPQQMPEFELVGYGEPPAETKV